jgi:hypothetical protein
MSGDDELKTQAIHPVCDHQAKYDNPEGGHGSCDQTRGKFIFCISHKASKAS